MVEFILYIVGVADDPFGETDCSTYGIDIDLLYFVYYIYYISQLEGSSASL